MKRIKGYFNSVALGVLTTMAVMFGTADANADTVDFTDNGSSVTPSITEGGVTVSGSDDLTLFSGTGIGVTGGSFTALEPGETMFFDFDTLVSNVVISDFLGVDTNSDGVTLTAQFEGIDANGDPVGPTTFPIDPNGVIPVSAFLDAGPLQSFSITMVDDGLFIGNINFDIASDICIDFTDNGTSVTPSITEGGVTVTGSANLTVFTSLGIGVSGLGNNGLNPSETMLFDFDEQMDNIIISDFLAFDTNFNGLSLSAEFEGFDEDGVSLGTATFPINPMGFITVSTFLNLGPVDSFSITMVDDSLFIGNLCFDEAPVNDSDGDGVADDVDACPNSDLSPTVIIDGCDSGVENTLFENGCTITDLIMQFEDAPSHGKFVSSVAQLLNQLKKEGVITGIEKNAIQSCVGSSSIPTIS